MYPKLWCGQTSISILLEFIFSLTQSVISFSSGLSQFALSLHCKASSKDYFSNFCSIDALSPILIYNGRGNQLATPSNHQRAISLKPEGCLLYLDWSLTFCISLLCLNCSHPGMILLHECESSPYDGYNFTSTQSVFILIYLSESKVSD